MNASDLIDRLEGVRSTGRNQWIARCPAHDDRSPSLSVRDVGDGRTLIHCFAGCPPAEVVEALGLKLEDLFPPRVDQGRPAPHGQRWDWRGLLRLLDHETLIVALAASNIASGITLTPKDHERLRQSADRIDRVARLAR